LKALGLGTALSVWSGVVTAKDDSTDADIDPLYGDARPSADSIPQDVPDHKRYKTDATGLDPVEEADTR
jgi:hypothetical protein